MYVEFQIEPGMIGSPLGGRLYVVVAAWKETWSLHHPVDGMTYELFPHGLEKSNNSSSDEILP